MKLLYEIGSGQVTARYPDQPDPIMGLVNPVASDGYALITVPESVAVPHAVIRVVEGDELSFVVDQEAIDNMWASVKQVRRQRLSDTDWIASVGDFTHPKKDDWIVYRQALRDITKQANPFALVWPAEPVA
jgi:hypothetical protein